MKSIRVAIISLVIGSYLTACGNALITIPTATLPVSRTETPTFESFTETTIYTPFPMETPIPTGTLTPLPTVPTNDVADVLLNFLDSNGGCNLPCWWGIVPGESTATDALHFLNQFPFDTGNVHTEINSYDGNQHVETTFGFNMNVPGEVVGPVSFFSSDGTIISILIHLDLYKQNYQVEQILRSYGKPGEIYIGAQSSSPVRDLAPTILILDYRERGMLIWYEYPTIQTGENLKFCLNAERTSLSLWAINFNSPDRVPIDEYLVNITGWTPRRLADATDFDVDSFYEYSVSSGSEKCIETPANLWP